MPIVKVTEAEERQMDLKLLPFFHEMSNQLDTYTDDPHSFGALIGIHLLQESKHQGIQPAEVIEYLGHTLDHAEKGMPEGKGKAVEYSLDINKVNKYWMQCNVIIHWIQTNTEKYNISGPELLYAATVMVGSDYMRLRKQGVDAQTARSHYCDLILTSWDM